MPAYGSPIITVTASIASLANGSAWQSAVVDNSTLKYADFRLNFVTKAQAGGTSVLNVYLYSGLNGSPYTDGASGSDATFTAANIKNAIWLFAVQMNAATSVTFTQDGLKSLIGGVIPDKFGFIFLNNASSALSATAGDHVLTLQGYTP